MTERVSAQANLTLVHHQVESLDDPVLAPFYGEGRAVVLAAGPNSCPPMVVGVGLGGTMEMAAICAKRAAARDLESHNHDPRYAAFEEELLELINKTGIGPQGLGGLTTALKVHV